MRGGCLQEVLNIVISRETFRYFGKLVAEERWLLTRDGRNRRFDCELSSSQKTFHERIWILFVTPSLT